MESAFSFHLSWVSWAELRLTGLHSALVDHLTDLVDLVFVGVNFSATGTVVYFDFLTKE